MALLEKVDFRMLKGVRKGEGGGRWSEEKGPSGVGGLSESGKGFLYRSKKADPMRQSVQSPRDELQ